MPRLDSYLPETNLDLERDFIMSMHRSFKAANKIIKRRNVLKRYERVNLLKARGQWKDGDKAYGLPKTKPGD